MRRAWLASLVLLFSPFAQAATRVSSDSNCPSADAISQRLLGLFAAGGPVAAFAVVRAEGDTLHIELSTPGESNQHRTVPATGDCDARAEMAALVIAAWLDVMPSASFTAPGLPPRPPPPVEHKRVRVDPDDPDSPAVVFDTRTLLSGALFGSVDRLGASAGAAAGVAMPRLLDAMGWAFEASMGLPRQLSLGQGTVRFTRPTFAALLTGELGGTRWRVRPQGGIALGVLSIQGRNFIKSRSSTTVMWAGVAGVTLARAWGAGELWLRLDGMAWPQGRAVRSQQVPTDVESVAALPEWELRLAVGIAWTIHQGRKLRAGL